MPDETNRHLNAIRAMQEIIGMSPGVVPNMAIFGTPMSQVVEANLSQIEARIAADYLRTGDYAVIPTKHTPLTGMPDNLAPARINALYGQRTAMDLLPPRINDGEWEMLHAGDHLLEQFRSKCYRKEDGTFILVFKFPEPSVYVGADYLAMNGKTHLRFPYDDATLQEVRVAYSSVTLGIKRSSGYSNASSADYELHKRMAAAMDLDAGITDWAYTDSTPALDALNAEILWKNRPKGRSLRL